MVKMDRSCIMFNCLWQLWDWLDPPVLTSSASMEGKKMLPPPQHLQSRPAPSFTQHHQQPMQQVQMQYPQNTQYLPSPTSSQSPQPNHMNQANGIIHQPPSRPYNQMPGPRSPLLENHQELYGTKQSNELSRQLALREQMHLIQQRAEQNQQRNIPMSNSNYSIPSPSQDPVLNAPVPPGFNASVHQAYLRRNPHQLEQQHLIYQNPQNVYQSPTQQPRIYQPYTSRIQQSNYISAGPSHTQILRQQYNELQQMKLHQQMQYQSQAQLQQQQTFAQRQIMNQHLHSRQQSQANLSQYDISPNMNQKDSMEFNNKLKNENVPMDEYIYNSPMLNARLQQRQMPQSPNTSQNVNLMNNKNIGELCSSPSTKSPSGSESRRSSSGTTQALRSPIAQRPLSAPVTMSGWLYKQGSDGLKVWRKRWFVLCEYCLFYYKGQEEDKLLGSVLLPSYKVSVCSPDDKIIRKFAFKLEHTNMRTYVLAASDRDQMNQWMKVLTMAALMQEGSINMRLNPSANNLQIGMGKNNSSYNNNTDQDEITPEITGGCQPMYENAPPKPRRSNEGYNSPSPERSMERYEPNYDVSRDQSLQNHKNVQKSNNRMNATSPLPPSNDAIYGTNTYGTKNMANAPETNYGSHNLSLPLTNSNAHKLEDNLSPFNYNANSLNKMTYEEKIMKNPPNSYNESHNVVHHPTNSPFYNYPKDKQSIYGDSNYQKMPPNAATGNIDRQNFERRTPDTYGRSAIVPGYYSKGRSGDYEDIYNNPDKHNVVEVSYRRPLSPGAYDDSQNSTVQNQQQRLNPNEKEQIYQPSLNHARQKKLHVNYTSLAPQYNTVPRPHSADFLEYESKKAEYDANVQNRYSNNPSRQPPRPKSSLDINTHDYDSYYYSEASYAEKMRQSAHYLRNKGSGASLLNIRHTKLQSPDYIRPLKTSTSAYSQEERIVDRSYEIEKEPTYMIHDQNKNTKTVGEMLGLNSNWTLRNKNLSHIIGQDDVYNRSNSALSDGSTNSALLKDQIRDNDGEFLRSASARLPISSDQSREGEGKREESMKRLLEWKQRMLQSPLTRKSTPATLSLARSLNHTKSSSQSSADRYLTSVSGQTFPKSNSKGSGHHQTSYNSYSSDDEERLADTVRSEPSEAEKQEQAGRSLTPTPQSTPPTIVSTITHTLISDSDTLNNKPSYDTLFSSSLKVENTSSPLTSNSTKNDPLENLNDSVENSYNTVDESDINKQLEYTDADLDEVLAMYEETEIEEKPVLETSKCNISKGNSPENKSKKDSYPDYEICEIKPTNISPDTKIKIREKIATPPSTPTNQVFSENHYLPMSPRKMIPSEELLHEDFLKNINALEESKKIEDNPYVEMSQGIGIESAFVNEETQAYEIVCVTNSKVEPVYMELSNVTGKNVFEEKSSSNSDLQNNFQTKSILRKTVSEGKNSKSNTLRKEVKSPPLPDILIPSQSKENELKSDSSDADDESSKDFSIETAYSRFSLSDNFRPASYYLQSKDLSDLQDSSDSEIIPPPPIPTTSPPMEDVDVCTSSEKTEINKSYTNNDTIKERRSTSLMVYGNTPSMYDTLFKGERVKRNRVSLPDNKIFSQAKHSDIANQSSLSSKSVPPSYKMSGNGDSDSLLSFNADRGSSRMSFESDFSNKFDYTNLLDVTQPNEGIISKLLPEEINFDCDDEFVELRQPKSEIDIERMLKRRPLSDDSCFEIESLNSTLNEISQEVNFNSYLEDLQSGSIFLPPKSMDATKLYSCDAATKNYPLDKMTVSYLNDRVAAIREEVQYENVNLGDKLMERSRSRASNVSNSASDQDTVSTFQTVYSLKRLSNSSEAASIKIESNTPTRSVSRNSLPVKIENESDISTKELFNHTRHASYEQPTISYYTKNTPQNDDASIQKNLNQSINHSSSSEKVNIADMAGKVSKSIEGLNLSVNSNKLSNHSTHSRESSFEQSAPYYYSDLSSQDNINLINTVVSPLPTYNKNYFVISNKLNNQRRKVPIIKKCDIGHIHNPIHSNTTGDEVFIPEEEQSLIAAAAKCVSIEFLSAADKTAEIDDKNIYESNSLKNIKHSDMPNSKNIFLTNYDTTKLANFDSNSSCLIDPNQREHNRSFDQFMQIISVPICNNLLSNNNNNNNAGDRKTENSSDSNNQNTLPSSSRNSIERNPRIEDKMSIEENQKKNNKDPMCTGEMMWDEDLLWSENLRRVSHRHARSLDHLDCLSNPTSLSGRHSVDLKTMLLSSENQSENKCKSTKISREVTYVNDNVKNHRILSSKRKQYKRYKHIRNQQKGTQGISENENDVYVQLALNSTKESPSCEVLDEGVYEQLAVDNISNEPNSEENSNMGDQYFLEDDTQNGVRKKFEIDREKLRQWDLMSSGLLKNESNPYVVVSSGGGAAEGEGMHVTTAPSASMSISTNEPLTKNSAYGLAGKKSFSGSNPTLSRGSSRDSCIPVRAVSPRVRSSSAQPWNHPSKNEDWNSPTYSQNLSGEDNWSTIRSPSRQSNQPIRAVSPRIRRASDVEERNNIQQNSQNANEPVMGVQNLSAGELLGRTHEELVLILIRLRRKQTSTANAIEQCCSQIKSVQSRLNAIEYLEQKQENLQRLEQLKHHLMELEKHYEKSKPLVHLVDNMVKLGTLYNRNAGGGSVPSTLDRLEYNQMIRERALMEQAMEQRRWAESSECLPREHIERRVEELRAMERWVVGEANTLKGLRKEREAYNEPALQHDLSRVHAMLAENSKKLEQTVAGNARLEQELMVLRQKLQQQQSNNAHQSSYGGSGSSGDIIDTRAAADATALLEDELRRVQQLVGDLQKQRQELSVAVRQLTGKSQSLGLVSPTMSVKQPSANDYSSNSSKDSANKARMNPAWVETDLDNGLEQKDKSRSASTSKNFTPLYIDTQSNNSNYSTDQNGTSPNMSDENISGNLFGNLGNVEKQEIKTVRIVKRESERRQRDRERSLLPGNNEWSNQAIGNTLDQLIEEETNASYSRTPSMPRGMQSNQPHYMQDNQSNAKGYLYQNDSNSSLNYHHKTQINPPNTLSLTNVNIPFDNISTSSMSTSAKFLSSPSLNNNDYLYNYGDSYGISKYLHKTPITSNYGTSKQGLSHSVPYLDNVADATHPITNGTISPEMLKNESVIAKGTAELSPVFTSEAARQIIIEMAEEKNGFVKNNNGSQHRRQVPKEKRRHYTAPHEVIAKAFEKSEDDDIFNQEKWWRARDDVDMERVLRGNGLVGNKHGPPPLIAPPDVVRSTLPTGPLPDHYSESTIDRLLAAPNKIIIPERYVPEQAPELSPEEQKKRREKVESIKKMLSSTTSSSDPNKSPDTEDKKQREHLLQLNQILAKQVMEKSKMVAVKALETMPVLENGYDSDDRSPEIELPLYQQRDNYFS